MSLTSGVQAAAASPVAAQLTVIDTVLTAAGWTQLTQKSAATMGTTDVVEVFVSPGTTVSSNVYTGMCLFIETDETNNRMRFRVTEVYDSAATGSPATNVKYGAPGNLPSTATTPDASFATHSGCTSYVSLFQAAAATQAIGWVNIPMSDSGFDYWLGANATTFIYTNNSSGTANVVIVGQLQYMGDLFTSTGNLAVYLSGNNTALDTTTASWTASGSTLNTGISMAVRFSRQPDSAGVSTTGAFAGVLGGPMPADWTGQYMSGGPVQPHRFYTTMVLFPAWIHGTWKTTGGGTTWNGTSGSSSGARTNMATMPEFVVHLSGSLSPGAAGTFTPSAHPAYGDTVDLDGDTYLSLGLYQKGQNETTGITNVALLVNNGAF